MKFTRSGDEANGYGALWTLPLVLPLVFFFSDSFYSVAFFFCFGFFSLWLSLSSLSLSLYWFQSSVFFLLRLCLFACVSFLICCSKGEGAGILGGKLSWCSSVGWPVLSSLCFCFSFAYSLIFLPWVLFFYLLFSCVCSPSLLPSVCIVYSLCSVCPLCVCPLFLFLFVLWFSSVYPRGPFCFLSLCFVLLVTSPRLSWPFSGFYEARECHA